MALEYIKVFYDWEEATEALTFEERGRLIIAMLQYAKGKDMIELTGNEKFIFPMCKNLIERAHQHYDVVVERNRKNGALGGKAKQANLASASGRYQPLPNASEFSQDKDKDKEKDKDKYKEKTKTSNGSFDIDDMFEAALRRSYGDDYYSLKRD